MYIILEETHLGIVIELFLSRHDVDGTDGIICKKKFFFFVVTSKQDKVEAEIHGNQSNGSKCI